jgi:hypothetical protein
VLELKLPCHAGTRENVRKNASNQERQRSAISDRREKHTVKDQQGENAGKSEGEAERKGGSLQPQSRSNNGLLSRSLPAAISKTRHYRIISRIPTLEASKSMKSA